MFTGLISAEQVAADPDQWHIVDCRFDLRDPQAGRRAYLAGHLPGAVYADLEQDLSGPVTPDRGRHPLPDPDELATRLGALGIAPDTQVVAYDDQGGAFAARLWWLLRWLGHSRVAVLDGGIPQWQAGGYGMETGNIQAPPVRFLRRPSLESVVTTEEILGRIGQSKFLLMDARAPERYRGDVEPIDPVAGHVPGAVNYPFQQNLSAKGCFHSAEELRARFDALLGHPAPEDLAVMCGSGVTACHHVLAMTLAGMKGATLYAGSWSEWIRDPSRPVARG